MARKQPRINFLAAWSRNVNPELRVCSVVATFSEQNRPRMFAARIAFPSMAAAHTWATGMPAYVAPRCTYIRGPAGAMVAWLAVDIDTARRVGGPPGPHEASVKRVRAFLANVRATGYRIDYQADNSGVIRRYGTLETFENFLEFVQDIEKPAAPVAYKN